MGAVVSERTLSEALTRPVIPTYDANMGEIYFFKTPHHPDAAYARDVRAADAALATSAAPTYFPAHKIEGRGAFIDGGIWANCPAVVGIVEAVSFCGKNLEDIHVLSVSTTNYPFRISRDQQLGGLFGWGPKIIETFMFAQAQAAVGAAQSLLRDRSRSRPADRFHRIDYVAEPRIYAMDDVRITEELIEIGRRTAEKVPRRTLVSEHFLNGLPREPFRPV